MKNKEELFQFEHCIKYHEVLRNKLKISEKIVYQMMVRGEGGAQMHQCNGKLSC